MTDPIDHFARTRSMLMGVVVGAAATWFWMDTPRPARASAGEFVHMTNGAGESMRIVADPEAECRPNESLVEIRSPGNNDTVLVSHERLTLTSTAEIHMSVGPVSKATP